ncbi:DUF4386 domain-containing protein [Paenibacillus mesophilus]|uniref:DUF4386 domain-containing protein n=1 Tax=Paenibacillus mesophilus TaxID=2582849 RepID=UPI00110E159D|nr:DUF4386 domain-containing protein [Paenibacillus mesophilus]TMV48053.1 DUF4386 domain-containing protein [Paenibacillus mesophilus]
MSRMEIRTAGIVLLLMPLLIIISWTGLMIRFEYPDILRQPVELIMQKYETGGSLVKLYWSGMVLSGMLIIPVVALLYRFTSAANRSLSMIAAGIGLASAVFHILGFSRWLFAMDFLAGQYTLASVTAGQKEAMETVFNALHMYLGVTIGETLGFLTMGAWVVLIAIALYQSDLMKLWITVVSVIIGFGIMAGTLEWTGLSVAAEINAYAYQAWIAILAGLGISFIRRSK